MRQNKQVYAIYFNFQFAGLADHDNYHEFCRLLGRFKVNYQVPILLYED
jgi:exportin-7